MPYIIAIILVLADQITKYLYVTLCGAPDVDLNGIVGLTYVENKGAAWGLFADNQVILYIISAIITLVLVAAFVKHYKKMNGLLKFSIAVIVAGAVGNLIDRFALGYVRDMIRVLFIDFPVFNIADMCITVGGVMLLLDVIFFEKEKKTPETATESDPNTPTDEGGEE